ncbi:PKD domain-containing protein [Methanosarcina mazei]|nr:PKD domain-containing protein [Methanosarcina mazei]
MSGNDGSQSEVPQAPTDPTLRSIDDTNSIDTVSEEPVLPAADFWSDNTSGGAPLKVQFFDESNGSPTSWNWNFGDRVTSTKQNPIHTYTTAGVYTVGETVTNEEGKDTEIKTKYITVTSSKDTDTLVDTGSTEKNTDTASRSGGTALTDTASQSTGTAPTADFSASHTTGEAPLKVSFTDESTGSPTEWKWNFGDGSPIIDGTTSAYQNPTHTYEKAGVYEVKETAINSVGRDTETKTGYITVTSPEDTGTSVDTGTASEPTETAPVADFSASQTSGEVPLTISFSDESTGSPTEWKWNFGDGSPIIDGTTSAYQNPTHTYEKAGVYEVKETAINSVGRDTEIKTGYITVT